MGDAMNVLLENNSNQVEEVMRRKQAKEVAAQREHEQFINMLRSARDLPPHAKPPKSTWTSEDINQIKIECLQAFAVDDRCNEYDKKTARMILKAMGLEETASAAMNLLISVGYFSRHVNLDLLKFNIPTDHAEEILTAADSLFELPDPDEDERTDLTHLKVYAIDVEEADELDDALSATRLPDGRIKVWIHVADPTSFLQPGSLVDKEAMKRSTSIYLPTATYPMFPEKLAMEGMSFKEGEYCEAVSVSVVLYTDGSIGEISVENSIIVPTYMLTYETAMELLDLNLEEEAELSLLSEAATLRYQWRQMQGAIDTSTIETRIKVSNPDDREPLIRLYVENRANPATRLVSEMMILCGEVIAAFGYHNHIPLPYRGQPRSNIDMSDFAHLPEGPVRSSALIKTMCAAEFDFKEPMPHGALGLRGYVQFTSPIRRYMDILAHYQVKAFLRGDPLPFSAEQLREMASPVNTKVRLVRRISSASLRYWMIEYLRRQPKQRAFTALVLRFITDKLAAILLVEVGIQDSVVVSKGVEVGDEIKVVVKYAHPRGNLLIFKEVEEV